MTTTSTKEMKLTVTLRDQRAKEIVESIPIKQRDEVIEKYIILGEMVASHASISTSRETVEQFFSPLRQDIEMIREQLKHSSNNRNTCKKRKNYRRNGFHKPKRTFYG